MIEYCSFTLKLWVSKTKIDQSKRDRDVMVSRTFTVEILTILMSQNRLQNASLVYFAALSETDKKHSFICFSNTVNVIYSYSLRMVNFLANRS